MPARSLCLLLLLGGGACGGEVVQMRPLAAPQDPAVRRGAIGEGGQKLYGALRAGRPETLLADDVDLRLLLVSEAASRYSALRAGASVRLSIRAEDFQPLAEATYGGVCLQGARVEPKGGPMGLREDGWVFDRALVAGERPGGRRVGAWIEGTFVYTPEGFVALELVRVEPPRWEHADLELAPCDMEVGMRGRSPGDAPADSAGWGP